MPKGKEVKGCVWYSIEKLMKGLGSTTKPIQSERFAPYSLLEVVYKMLLTPLCILEDFADFSTQNLRFSFAR